MRRIPALIHTTLQKWESELFESNARVYTMLCVVGVLLYAKTFLFGYTYLDDHVLVLNNIPFLGDLGNIFKAFTQDVFFMTNGTTAYYRPLLTISFMPEAMLGKALPFFYHFTNVGIHLTAVCLLYLVFTKLKYSKRISLLLALIFLVHPALTQAVAWIPGRNDSLLAIFVLASFKYLLDFIEEGKREYIAWSVVFFSLALFTKETAIALPVLFVLYLWIRDRLSKTAMLEFGAGWLIAILVWLPLRIMATSSNPQALSIHDMFASFLTNVPGTLQLLGKAFFPFNLSVLPILQDTTFLWGYAAVALITAILLLHLLGKQTSRRSSLMMLFGFVWFLLFLWPSLIGSDSSGATDFIEHRLYLPLIGLLIILAESSFVRSLNEPAGEWFLQPWLVVLLIFFGMTFVHENVFADKLVFWQNAAFNSPHSSLAQKNLGAMYYLDQNYPLAETYSKKALAVNPQELMVHNNLGLIYAGEGRTKEAEQEYLQELSFNPQYDSAHFNLGLLYYGAGDYAAARKQWEMTLQINPNYTDAIWALLTLQAQRK
ncbi:MAG: tetratricopeptide repeat protein [Candidatus Parcubacteria bacterium]|nr:tetratricopeptide repeat protein [Candidatus Parcubacteria bacterium]